MPQVDLGVQRGDHDRVGVEAALGDVARARADHRAVHQTGEPDDVLVVRLVGQAHLGGLVATDAVDAAEDQRGAARGSADLPEIGPAVRRHPREVAVLHGVGAQPDAHVVPQRDGRADRDGLTVQHEPDAVPDQRDVSPTNLEGRGRIRHRGLHRAVRAQVDVIALHELAEVDALQQGAPLAQPEQPLVEVQRDHGAVGRAVERSSQARVRRRRGLGRAALREHDPRPERRRDLLEGGRRALLDHAEDQVGERAVAAVHDAEHRDAVGRRVALDPIALLQVWVDDVNQTAVGVLLETVEQRPLKGRVVEAVQPVRADGELKLVVVETPDLAVALPLVRQVGQHGDLRLRPLHRPRVQVGHQARDELARAQAQVVPVQLRPAVLDEPEGHRTQRKEKVVILFFAEHEEARGERRDRALLPALPARAQAPAVRLAQDDEDVGEVGDGVRLLVEQVGREPALPAQDRARGGPEPARIADQVLLGAVLAQEVVVDPVLGPWRQDAITVAREAAGASAGEEARDDVTELGHPLSSAALPLRKRRNRLSIPTLSGR